MAIDKNKTFTRKPFSGFLYKWAPQSDLLKNDNKLKNGLPTFCNAEPFSQGEDWVTTYSYEFEVINGVQHHFAYVECDYVQ